MVSTVAKLQGRVYAGQQVQLMTTSGGAAIRKGYLHFLGTGVDRFVFVCDTDTTFTFGADDVIGISKTGNRITIKGGE